MTCDHPDCTGVHSKAREWKYLCPNAKKRSSLGRKKFEGGNLRPDEVTFLNLKRPEIALLTNQRSFWALDSDSDRDCPLRERIPSTGASPLEILLIKERCGYFRL